MIIPIWAKEKKQIEGPDRSSYMVGELYCCSLNGFDRNYSLNESDEGHPDYFGGAREYQSLGIVSKKIVEKVNDLRLKPARKVVMVAIETPLELHRGFIVGNNCVYRKLTEGEMTTLQKEVLAGLQGK